MYTVYFQFHSESELPFFHEESFYSFKDAYNFFKHLDLYCDNEIEFAGLEAEGKFGANKLMGFTNDFEDEDELPFS